MLGKRGSRRPTPAWTTVFAVALAVSFSGCLDVVGCWGDAQWRESHIGPWLEEHAYASGLSPHTPPLGLTYGSKLAAAMPHGAQLQLAMAERLEGGTELRILITTDGLLVESSSPSARAQVAPRRTVLDFFNQTMGAVYQGSEENRTAAAHNLSLAWTHVEGRDHAGHVRLFLAGPWDFDAIVPDGARFARESPGIYVLKVGTWSFTAGTMHWMYSWDGPHWLVVDHAGDAHLDFSHKDTPQEAQDLVRSAIPAFNWTFQDFDFHTTCLPGPLA